MMKKLSYLLALIVFCSVALIAGISAQANAEDYTVSADGNYKYGVIDKNEKTIRLNRCDIVAEDLYLPDEVDGYRVVEIGSYCVMHNDVTKTIHIGKTVQTVFGSAFYGLIKHEAIVVDDENPYLKAENGILYDITGATLIRCPQFYPAESLAIPEGVTEISPGAFAFYSSAYKNDGHYYFGYQKLKEITIPDSVTKIGSSAFGGSYITELYVPDSVTQADERAFWGLDHCKSVYLGAGVPAEAATYLNSSTIQRVAVSPKNPYLTVENNVLFSKDKSVLYCYPGGYDDNTEYHLPNAVKTIETNAFIYNNLQSIDLNEVEVIKSGSFDYSSKILNWVIPKTVKSFWNVINIPSKNLCSFTFLNPKCSISISWFGYDTYHVTIYGFPGSTAEEYVKKNTLSYVYLTFSPLHTAESDADIYSAVHSYTSTTIAPTCTEQGYTLQKCSVCGIQYKENYQEPLGHNYIIQSSILPTCTEQGYTVCECSRCGDRKKGNYTGATGHSFTVTEREEPTCTDSGFVRRKCVFCGENSIEYFDATGHDYYADSVQAPTCTAGGYTTYVCRNCSDSYNADNTEPLGHRYTEKVTKAATQTEAGTLATACDRCGMVRSTSKIECIGEMRLPASLLTYTGTVQETPVPVILDVLGNSVPAENYTVTCIRRADGTAVDTVSEIGQYKVSIVFKNRYAGTYSLYFSVLPKPVVCTAVSPADAGAVVKWETDDSVDGYEVLYAQDSGFTNAQRVRIEGEAAQTALAGLTGNKQYYIKIRSYKNITVDEKNATLFSDYSDVKTVVPTVPPVVSGWVKKDGLWYYGNGDGTFATGWKQIGGKWYLFKYADSSMITGWCRSGSKWYWFGTDGAMKTGWQKISGKWYCFNSSGAMLAGWQKISGKWYYFNSSGAMLTGWQKISGKWYYLNSGGDMKTGWLKDGGKWYYLETSGAMLANTSKTIGGKTYQFNAAGVCTNP